MFILLTLFNGESFYKHDFDYHFVGVDSVSIEVSDVVSEYVAITTAVGDDLVLACTVTINLAFFWRIDCYVNRLGLVMRW